jgi:hypothetical protein
VAVILLQELSIQLDPLRVIEKAYNFRILTTCGRWCTPPSSRISGSCGPPEYPELEVASRQTGEPDRDRVLAA